MDTVDDLICGFDHDGQDSQAGLTEAVAHLDDTFAHLRESLICSAKRPIAASEAGELDRRLQFR